MAKILVIDDEAPIRSLIRRTLERVGHTIVEASDGALGVELFEASPFDLVITDLLMPGQEGIETILQLREQYPDIKILVVSGGLSFGGRTVDKEGPLSDAEVLGADASLSKPFEVNQLVETVNGLLPRP
jgi:CheY-like chemotaxis protein